MEPSRVDRILEEWAAVTGRAHRPATSPRRCGSPPVGRVRRWRVPASSWPRWSSRWPSWATDRIRTRRPRGATPTPSTTCHAADAEPVADAITEPDADRVADAHADADPDPRPDDRSVRSRLAGRTHHGLGGRGRPSHRRRRADERRDGHLPARHAGEAAARRRPRLGPIDGTDPGPSPRLTVAPGDVVKTFVQDANYCGPEPVAPVSVAFVLDGGGRIVATPLSPTDATVPPCNGAGSAGDIEMQPWAR